MNPFTPLDGDEEEDIAGSEPLLTPLDVLSDNDDTDPALVRTRELLQAHDQTLTSAFALVNTPRKATVTTDKVPSTTNEMLLAAITDLRQTFDVRYRDLATKLDTTSTGLREYISSVDNCHP